MANAATGRTLRRIIGPLVIAEGLVAILFAVALLMDGASAGVIPLLGVLAFLTGAFFCWAGAMVAGYLPSSRLTALALLVVGIGAGFLAHGFLLAAVCGVNCPPTVPHWIYTGPAIFAGTLAICAVLLWFRHTRVNAQESPP